jgi:probable rRNA maturation factor
MIKSELNSKVRTTLGRAWLASVEKSANKVLKIKKKYVVSVALVGPKAIQTLNKKYRGKNKSTDVLSFSNLGKERFIAPGGGEKNIGEIVICPQVARAGAKMSGHNLTREIQTLYAHGLLHILGYGHGRASDAKKMFKLQEDIISKIK